MIDMIPVNSPPVMRRLVERCNFGQGAVHWLILCSFIDHVDATRIFTDTIASISEDL